MITYEKYIAQYKYDYWFSKIPETDKIIEMIMPKEYEFNNGKRVKYRVDNEYYPSFEEALEHNMPM